MAPELYKVSVPGSMMLLGEHAVLVGKQAVVCAVKQRLYMQLTPQASNSITITDSRLGTLQQELTNLQVQQPFQFVLSAIMLFKDQIKAGFILDINSEFSSVIGLGSSAAVTVATIAVLANWIQQQPLSNAEIFAKAHTVILQCQGSGSGADLAASVYGGVLGYSMQPRNFIPLPVIPNLTAVYCGYKTPTPEVIKIVRAAQELQPSVYARIFQAIHECAQQAITAITQANWVLLGAIFTRHHALQVELGVSDPRLNQIVSDLSAQHEIYGAKISGAGLGDCVIGLGELAQQIIPLQDGMLQFPIQIDQQGLIYDN